MTRHNDFFKTSKILDEIDNNRNKYLIIHYSCESFYDKKDGKSPRITAIAIQHFDNTQTDLFSLHKSAEILNYSIADIENKFDELEQNLLSDFFNFVKQHSDKYWIHWNMRDSNFGFKALEHRYRVLTGEHPIATVSDDRKIDLARIFKLRFTNKYADHPRIMKLIELNNIKPKDLLTGQEEAQSFNNKEFIRLSFSTTAKVDVFSEFLTLAIDNRLITKTTKKEIYGTSLIGHYYRFKNSKLGSILIFLFNIIFGAIR